MITILATIAIGYLLGSIPTGVWIGLRFRKVDIRQHGSKSIGATNVFRVLGTKLAIAVLIIDIAKGYLACFLASKINLGDTLLAPQQLALIAGLAAVIGHLFPIFANFKGGKGVATGAGMLLFLLPAEVGMAILIFIFTVLITRYVSLGSILATSFITISVIIEKFYLHYEIGNEKFLLACIIIIIILYTHRTNIKRLMNGTENKFGRKK